MVLSDFVTFYTFLGFCFTILVYNYRPPNTFMDPLRVLRSVTNTRLRTALHFGLCAFFGLCTGLIWFWLFPASWPVLMTPLAFVSTHSYCLTIKCCDFCKFCFPHVLYSIATAFRILVASLSFIVPSVVQWYFVHWLTLLPIAQPMMKLQGCVMFHIALNLWCNFY